MSEGVGMNVKREQWAWLGVMLGGPTVVVLTVQLLIVRTSLFMPLSADLARSFLGTMAQVLAGILAIVFSVSVLAVEIASDRYTPRLFSYFKDDPVTWRALASLLACTLLSVVPIGIQAIPMYQWGFLAMSWLFVFCLLTMVDYFRQTLWLLDPRNLARRIRDEGLQALKKQDEQKVLDAITQLGDVAIKAFKRGEDEITKKYLDNLQEIQKDLISPDLISILIPSSEDKDIISAYFRYEIRSPVVEQYYRVFKIAAEDRNKEITLYIAGLLYEIVVILIEQDGNKEILKGILQQYREFIKIAVENTNVSRFSLVRYLRQVILPSPYAKVFSEEYHFLCLGALIRVNETIIDHQDFELWNEELDYFSSIASVENVYDSLNRDLGELLRELRHVGVLISGEQLERWNAMVWPIRTRITSTNKRVFELGMSEIEHLILASEQQFQEQAQRFKESLPRLWMTTGMYDASFMAYVYAFLILASEQQLQFQEQVQRLKELLQRLWITTRVYDAFFETCVRAFYREQFGYIKELWRHVNPTDANAHWANTNLIRLDIEFLTHQMVKYVSIPWSIEGYHGVEVYVLGYCLLCLAYVVHQAKSDWHPTVPHFTRAMLSRGDEYSVAMGQELSAVHTFLVNLPHYAGKVLAQYDTVASMSKEWDDVFDGQASDALEKARNWLADEKRRQGWKEKAESIIKNLPLDESRVEEHKKAALEHYQSQSRVNQLAITENSGEKAPTEPICYSQHCDKQPFTLIGQGRVRTVGFLVVHQVVSKEIDYIVNTILEHDETKLTEVKQLTFDVVAKAVEGIREGGYEAMVLLAPSQQIGSAWHDDSQFRTHMLHEGDERYLKVGESTKLRILELDGDHAFVLDRKAGNWKTVEPLKIEVTECDKNPLKVHITAQEVVDYQVLNPKAVEILKFTSPRKQKSGLIDDS
jgi:hypothetical protein